MRRAEGRQPVGIVQLASELALDPVDRRYCMLNVRQAGAPAEGCSRRPNYEPPVQRVMVAERVKQKANAHGSQA
jgi:hypothetical protein